MIAERWPSSKAYKQYDSTEHAKAHIKRRPWLLPLGGSTTLCFWISDLRWNHVSSCEHYWNVRIISLYIYICIYIYMCVWFKIKRMVILADSGSYLPTFCKDQHDSCLQFYFTVSVALAAAIGVSEQFLYRWRTHSYCKYSKYTRLRICRECYTCCQQIKNWWCHLHRSLSLFACCWG